MESAAKVYVSHLLGEAVWRKIQWTNDGYNKEITGLQE